MACKGKSFNGGFAHARKEKGKKEKETLVEFVRG
jgi:hypothetical protein